MRGGGESFPVEAVSVSRHDARYSVAIYGGVSYLHSRNNFADEFPEVLLTVEPRFVDPRADRGGWVLRGYFRAGLTATTHGAAAGILAMAFPEGGKTLETTGGFGFGRSWAVAHPSDGDVHGFALMAVGRIGILSLEHPTTPGDPFPFQWFAGPRIENEGGYFAGAFAEIGVGGSSQFGEKGWPRLKFEGIIPFLDPRTVGFAVRVTVDRPFPGTHHANRESRAGDIKISLLARFDVRQLFDALFGSANSPQ